MSENNKKLYRIDDGKMIAGVYAGLGEYFEIDAPIIRLGQTEIFPYNL